MCTGQEFRAKKVQDLMERKGVTYSPTQNETKASTSERAILTIRQKLARYFTYQEDYSYLPVLQDIAYSYNHTYHRTIGFAPAEVNDNNQEEVRLSTFLARQKTDKSPPRQKKHFKFKTGDYVRISHLKTIFTRAYGETFTGELFVISKRYHRGTLPVYRLRDMQNEEIKGTFYESEIQKVNIDPNKLWKIDKIFKSRGKGANKEFFVRWKYFPKKFDSWINANEVQ